LRTSRHIEIDEDDDIDEHQFNEENYDGYNDDEIEEEEEEEEDNSNYIIKRQCVMKLSLM
jgi:hypothetical protein